MKRLLTIVFFCLTFAGASIADAQSVSVSPPGPNLSLTGPPIISSNVIVGFGDSYIIGGGTTGTCSESFNVSPATPTGTCILDVLGINYGAKVVNLGVSGTCLGTYGSSNYCFTFGNSGVSRYVSQLIPWCGPNNYILFEYDGINEANHSDPGFTRTLFQSQLDTILSACIAAGEPASQILLTSTPHVAGTQSYLYQSAAATADEAIKYGARMALTYEALVACWNDQVSSHLIGSVCTSDGLHPNAAVGVPLYDGALEASNYANSLLERDWSTLWPYSYQPNNYQAAGDSGNVGLYLGTTSTNADIQWNKSNLLMGGIQSTSELDMYQGGGGGYLWSLIKNTGDVSTKGGLTVLNTVTGNTLTYPWRPASDPTCTIAAAGTSCSTTVTMLNSAQRCAPVVEGTGLLGGVIIIAAVSYSGTTETITADAVSAVAGGGAVTFSNPCV
jgi:hypothetical protein